MEASTRQPASDRETSVAAAKATATAMAMATGNATRRHHGYLAAPWSSRLKLWPRSLWMTLMVATAVSPLLAGRL